MRITINPVLDMETLTWVGHDGVYEYDGPVALFGGPSKESKQNEQAQMQFYQQITQQQNQTFAQQQDLLNKIKAITEPILAKGPTQYGFSPEEDALLRSTITDAGARATVNAVNATRLADKQRSGGTDILPTGAQAQEEEAARVLSGQSTATNLANEKLAGYSAGNMIYNNALSALTGVAGLQNPTAYTTAATGAGQGATSAINLADSERSTLLSSLLGGAISGGLALATGGASKALGIGAFGGSGGH